jgi:hypothetical protein
VPAEIGSIQSALPVDSDEHSTEADAGDEEEEKKHDLSNLTGF